MLTVTIIIGLLGISIGFFAGASYATRGANNTRDEAERYAAECHLLHEQVAHLRRSLNEPSSGIVPREQLDELQSRLG